MKKDKPTYITDLTTEIMNNRDLLNAWAKNSVDLEFLELTVDILSDLDLLFSWDCNNALSAKLAGIFSGNQDFKLKNGMVIKIDESYDFQIEPSLYKKLIKKMIDAEAISSIIRKDKLKQGQSLEQIKEEERYNKIASYIDLFEKTKGYESNDFKFMNENLLPKIIERNNELKRQFLEKKADEFGLPNRRELYVGNEFLDKDKVVSKKPKQLPEKWYALQYWIEINANGQLPPINPDGQFIKNKLEEEGRKRIGKGGQGFYIWVKNLADDLNDEKKLNRTFKNWKEVIVELSNNDPKIIDYIQKKYSS